MRDFTLQTYKMLCLELKKHEYKFITFGDYCSDAVPRKFVILRHDVDRSPERALTMAGCEKELNILSSYYFRVVRSGYDEEAIKRIADMGHEIGYHYEDFSAADGDLQYAMETFKANLSKLRQLYPVRTICMHGSPLSKWDNRALWEHCDYRTFGIIGEPYMDTDFSVVLYLTDTGRTWNGGDCSVRDSVEKNRHCGCNSTSDIIDALDKGVLANQLMLTVHPQRWHDALIPWFRELIWQSCKNVVKRNFLMKQ